MPTKPEKKIQVNKEREIRGLDTPIIMDRDEGKTFRKGCVVKDIEYQQEKRRNNNGTNEDEGV